MHECLRVLMLIAAGYAGLSLLVYVRQSSYVYYPDRTVGLTPAYFHLAYEELRLATEDGETIAAWFIPRAKGGAGAESGDGAAVTALFCHGNGGNIGGYLDSVNTLHNLGCNVLIFDYRGYGDSTGNPTERGTYMDVMAAWNHLVKERKIEPGRIVVYGWSLGGSIAAWLAEQVRPGALVVESCFTSAPDMAARMFPYLPIRLLCRFKYDTLGAVRNVKCPVLVAHSKADKTIPFEHGRRLFDAANEPKQFVETAGNHNDGGLLFDSAGQSALGEFIGRLRVEKLAP